MKLEAKLVCKELLKLSINEGFGCHYPLAPIAETLGITEVLYDGNTESGILWDIGPHGEGLIDIEHSGESAAICWDLHSTVEARCWISPKEKSLQQPTL